MYFKGILTFLDLKPTRLGWNDILFLSFLPICKILLKAIFSRLYDESVIH
jgi:hypothetical protein